MTSQATQIQTLIDDIDAVLSKTSARLPWVMSGEAAQQRRVLEQTRQYLATLQSQALADAPPTAKTSAASANPAEDSAQQLLQAVLQEMGYLRSHVLQPLRADIDRLHQEREALTAEIQQLQAQRQEALPPQTGQQQLIEDFMRSLMSRVQEQLAVQVTQAVANVTTPSMGLSGGSMGMLSGDTEFSTLSPEQRVVQVQRLQAQSDQLLLKLDSTLRVIFDSLQTNIQGYQDSLGQGLEKMHSLGQQGEAMFAALVNRLAQQLGREASSYLQSSFQTGEWEPVATSQLRDTTTLPSLVPPAASRPTNSTSPSQVSEGQPSDEPISESQIDQLLAELKAGGVTLGDDALSPEPEAAAEPTAESSAAVPEGETAPEPEAIAPAAPESEDEPLPLEPIAEWALSDDTSLAEWSPDEDINTLETAFDILEGVSAAPDDAAIADHLPPAEETDDAFYSLFSAEPSPVALDSPPDPIATDAPSVDAVDAVELSLGGLAEDGDLFGGLADPAEEPVSSDEIPRRDESLSELSTQALEGVLFSGTEPLFTEEQLAGALASRSGDAASDRPSSVEEEDYTVAQPEEDLLSDAGAESGSTVSLDVDDGVLNQLAADLQALESGEEPYTLDAFGEAIAPNELRPEVSSAMEEAEQSSTADESPPVSLPQHEAIVPLVESLELIGLDAAPHEPPPRSINDGTLTQPTLNSFFDAVPDRSPEPSLTTTPEPGSTAPAESSVPVWADSSLSGSPISANSEAVSDLDLIWESVNAPEYAPENASENASESSLSLPQANTAEEPETEPGFTLADAFGDFDRTSEVLPPESSTSFDTATIAASFSTAGNALTLDELGTQMEPSEPAMSTETTPNPVPSSSAPSNSLQDDTEKDLSDILAALEGSPTVASWETSAVDASLEEQNVFALDTVTIENLFEDWPDEAPASASKGGLKKN